MFGWIRYWLLKAMVRPLPKYRNDIIEECARVAERHNDPDLAAAQSWTVTITRIAAAIRALKDKP